MHSEIPQDSLVKADSLNFGTIGTNFETELVKEGKFAVCPIQPSTGRQLWVPNSIHPNAFGQICTKAKLPLAYAKRLLDVEGWNPENTHWGKDLLAKNLNEIYSRMDGRFLARAVNNEVRGFLSDKYKRLDSRPLLDQFCQSAADIGAIPIEGYASDVKVWVKAMLPTIFEPVENEVVGLGVCWSNSDYGVGANTVQFFVMRLWCTNYAMSNHNMRQVHLGKRLDDEIQWSNKTYELDTKATASAIDDIVKKSLDKKSVENILQTIKKAHEEEVDPAKALTRFKSAFTHDTAQKVLDIYESPDVLNLPAGDTKWRMSNALSWIAQEQPLEEKIQLMNEAGRWAGI
jgi:hypothetical protein